MADLYALKSDNNIARATVESKEGSSFEVHLEDNQVSPEKGVAVRLYIDGVQRDGRVCNPHSSSYKLPVGDMRRLLSFWGQPDSKTTERPFIFSKIALKEEDSDEDGNPSTSAKFVQHVGTIRIDVHRVNEEIIDVEEPEAYRVPKEETVGEQVKKASVSHQTSLGAPKPSQGGPYRACTLIDEEDEPFRRFEFKYCSRALLEARGLVEERPSHSPTPNLANGGDSHNQAGSPSPTPAAGPAPAVRVKRAASHDPKLHEEDTDHRNGEPERAVPAVEEEVEEDDNLSDEEEALMARLEEIEKRKAERIAKKVKRE